MLKATAIISALIATAYASPLLAKDTFTGPYIGIEAGYELLKDKAHFTSPALGIDDRQKDNLSGFNGGAFAGYGQTFNQFYLGAELNIDGSGINSKKTTNGETDTQKHEYGGGADVHAGFLPTTSTLVYGILGGAYGKFNFSAVDPGLGVSASSNKWLAGMRAGLGAETILTPNTIARMDWVYTHYQQATSSVVVNGVGNIGTIKVSPITNVFHLGIAYSF